MLMHEHAAERARIDGTADRFDLGAMPHSMNC